MIVAGFGFTTQATPDSLAAALAVTGHMPDAIATLADKAISAPFATFAAAQSAPVLPITPEDAAAVQTQTHSAASQDARALASVAEATALAGAGRNAVLLVTRQISPDRMATCAIAQGDGP